MMVEFDYQKEVEAGYITKRNHPENPELVILNYTNEAVYERVWNEATLQSRGLIINENTGEVKARPFRKFFNYGEETGKTITLPEGEPTFSLKLDGSLGISYTLEDEMYWATRGSFKSPQSKVANRIWKQKYSHVDISKANGITLLVEIIDRHTRVVVNYNDQSDLILIGAVRTEDGYDFSHKELVELANDLGMNVNQTVDLTFEQALDLAKEIDHQQEGWVLRWPNGFRLKIKGQQYMEIHKILYGVSDKQKVESWSTHRLAELITYLPEEYRPEMEELDALLTGIEKDLKVETEALYHDAITKHPEDRKAFSLYLKTATERNFIRNFAFTLRDSKQPNYRYHIYRNYIAFLEGTSWEQSI